jgi:hypothetical protein
VLSGNEIGNGVFEQLLVFPHGQIAVEIEQGDIAFFSLANFKLTIHIRTCLAENSAKYLFA